jgi:transcriptional regulator with XRE-family HTH domain
MTIGSRIRALRIAQGLGLREFARQLGGSAAFLGHVEHDRTTCTSLAYLSDVADQLGTSLDYLAGRTDDPTFRPLRQKEGR